MANLRTLSSKPDQIVLGKGGTGSIGNALGLVIFVVIACVGLSSFIDQGGDINPIVAVIALVIGFAVLNAVLGSLRSTRVIVDATQQRAARVDSIVFLPYKSQDMAFNLIRDVQLSPRSTSPLAHGFNAMQVWQVSLQGTDGSSLLLNDGGTRTEMENLRQQVATLINRPMSDAPQESAGSAPTVSPSTANEGMASLLGTLNAFTQANNVPLSPTFSAYPNVNAPAASQTAPRRNRAQQRRRQRAAQQNAPRPSAPAQPPANTLTSPSPSVVPNTLYVDTTTPTTIPQSAVDLNAASVPPVLYSAPPVLVMPALPALPSFAPALNMPSFAPIGSSIITAPQTTIPDVEEIKEVRAEPVQTLPNNITELQNLVAQDPQNAEAQYRLGRRLYANGNLPAAETAYQRALSVNPANASVQNDLGVLYMQQNKWRHAETALRRAVALDPTYSPSRYNLGFLLNRTGGRRAALEQFRLGAQGASSEDAPYFENALSGSLNAPILSSEQ